MIILRGEAEYMGYIIRVNHSYLSRAAEKAKKYVAFNSAKMKALDIKIAFMHSTGWKGTDASAFADQWKDASSKYSVNGRLNTAMRNYANCIAVAANKYKRAQADAINRANRLR